MITACSGVAHIAAMTLAMPTSRRMVQRTIKAAANSMRLPTVPILAHPILSSMMRFVEWKNSRIRICEGLCDGCLIRMP